MFAAFYRRIADTFKRLGDCKKQGLITILKDFIDPAFGTQVMPSHDWRALYPYKSNFMEAAGARVHYVDEGPRDASESLLLVHGNPTWSFYWRDLINAFGDKYRVV
ncbi:MAG: hypothetical protein MI757_13145, partial [Pirellulales bacterium]|nr:hypothetical protein [Pirellulales bacterium]